jgi:hypothetical protein
MMTRGNWTQGEEDLGTIISDDLTALNPNEYDYYGGKLIAESIRNKDDLKVMVQSKKMLELLCEVSQSSFFNHMKVSKDISHLLKELEGVHNYRKTESQEGKGLSGIPKGHEELP